jgi:hypothetical protein
MGEKKTKSISNNDIIRASEIGQYHYCSMLWYLQKKGFQPKSPLLEAGTKKHIELGKTIDNVENKIKKSRVFAVAGWLILILAILIFIFGVIL